MTVGNDGKGGVSPSLSVAPSDYDPDSLSFSANAVQPLPLADNVPLPEKKRNLLGIFTRRANIILVVLLVLGMGGVLWAGASRGSQANKQAAGDIASKFKTQELPLKGLAVVGSGLEIQDLSVVINGGLTANDGIVITPSLQPSAPKAGQMYYDQDANQLGYFNGTEFVLLGAKDRQVVESLGGLVGQVGLGGGLAAVNNQLINAGVLSLGGATGTIVLGNGLNLNDNVLQNTGILNITAGTPNVTITDNGGGSVSVSVTGSGTGTVTSGGGTTGAIPLFTTSQNIEDSILSQSGGNIAVGGTLSVTGALTLGSALSVANGGTGATSLTANGVVVGNGAGALSSVAAGGAGLCLVSTAGAPTWGSCAGGGVTSLNGLAGALSIANASAAGSTITIDDATTAAKGIASFNSTNFTVGSGAVNTVQNINSGATPTFAGVNTNNITPSAALTVGVSAQTALLQGSTTTITSSGVGNDIVLNSADTIELQDNTNVTGNVVATGDVAVNGGDITATGALNITPGGTLTAGVSSQTLTLQGNASTSLRATNGANTTIVAFTSPTANTTLNFPALSAGTYTVCTTSGNCAGAGVTLQAAYDNSSTPEITLDATRGALTIRDASTPIGANLLEVQNNGGATTYLAVTASGLTVTGTATISSNVNSSGGALQTGGTTRVDNTGNLANIGNLTLSGAISGGTSYSGSGNINTTAGVIQTNSTTRIDNSGNLTNIAAITASGSATLQGGSLTLGTNAQAGSVVINDGSSNTGTLQVAALGQNTVYTLPDPGAGTATICLTSGNCSGVGGGVTTPGGTTNTVPKFTGSQTLGDSIITDNGSTVTIGGTLAVNTISPTGAFTAGVNGQTSTVQGSITTITSSGVGNDIILNSADTIELQDNTNITGNLDVSGTLTSGTGNAFQVDASGNVTAGTYNTNTFTAANLQFGAAATATVQSAGSQALTITGNAASTWSTSSGNLTVQAASSLNLKATSGNVVLGTSDTTGTLLVLDIKTDATDPTGTDGAIYYNSNLASFRCYQGGAWTNCITASGGFVSLQNAYDNGNTISTDASGDIAFTLNNQNFTIANAAGATGSTTFSLTDGANATPASQLVLITNNDVNEAVANGLTIGAAAGGITDGLDVSDTDIVNAINVGDNTILGTTAVIDFTNFDVSSAGAITAASNATLQGGSLTLGTTSQAGSLVINDGSSNTGTVQVAALGQNTVYTLPDPGSGTVSICLTTGNCAGTGGGVTGTGTNNRITKFTSTGSTVGDSTITDNGTTVTTSVDLVIQGGDATIGVSNTQTGTLNFADSGSAFLGSIVQATLGANRTYTLPDASGDVCLSSGNCLGGGGGGANTALSNLASVNINTALNATSANLNLTTTTSGNIVLNSAGTIELQDNTNVTGTLGVSSTLTVTAGGASITGNTTIATTAGNTLGLGNSTGALTVTGSSSSTFVINGATVDATEFNRLDGKDAALVDTNDAVNTAITGTGALGSGSITSGFGSIDTGADNITTTGTLQGTTSVLTQSLDRTTAGALNIGASTATSIVLGQNTSLTGAATFTSGTGTVLLQGNTDIDGTVSLATKRGTTYTTPGSANDVAISTASLYLLDTSGAAQTITGITAGRDGQYLTLVNADAALAVTLSNNSGSSLAANRITTGTGADISIPVGGSISLIYDTASSLWRVTSGVAGGNGTCATCANTALSNLSGVNINAALNATSADLNLTTTTSGNIVLNSAGTIELQDNTNVTGTLGVSSTLTVSAGGASIAGNTTIATTAGNTLGLGNSTGTLTATGSSSSTFVINGVTVDATEFNRLDGKDAALVDTNDAVGTAITGTGTLTSGALGAGFTTVAVGQGGTGATTFTSNGVLYGNGTGAVQATAAGTNGQCLVGNTGAAPSWASCTSLVTLQNAYVNGNTISTTGNDIAFTLNTSQSFTVATAAANTAGGVSFTSGNTSGTQTNGLLINRNGVGGTTTNGINITQTAGTLTNGLAFTGTIGTDINRGSGSLSLNGNTSILLQAGGSTKATVGANDVTLATNIDLLLQGATAYISNTQGQSNSEAFGLSASVAGTDSVSVGKSASTGFDGVAIGSGATATGAGSIAIGRGANAGSNTDVILIGADSAATASHQVVIGGGTGTTSYINDIYLGAGVTDGSAGTTLGTVAINATGGSGANNAGANLNIAGGKGTGTANGGAINLQIAKPGIAGSSLNSLATVASLSGATGAFTLQNASDSSSAFKIINAANTETVLTVDTAARSGSGGNLIKIGNSTGTDTALTILQLDAATADPTSNLSTLNGGLFYNSTTNKVSLIENGTVKIICNTTDLGCGTGTVTLQSAYDNGNTIATSSNDIGFTLNGSDKFTVATAAANTLGGVTFTSGNTSGTQTNGLLYDRNGVGGTTTNGINITQTAGTLTNGLAFTGTIGTDINRGSGSLSLNGNTSILLKAGGATKATLSTTSLTLASNEDLLLQGATAYVSNPQGSAESEAFGLNASVAGLTNGEAVAVGFGASSNNYGVAVGHNAVANSSGDTALGHNTFANGGRAIALGDGANASNVESIAIGYSAVTTAANQVVIGGDDGAGAGEITQVVVGNGATNAAPIGFTLQGTSGSGSNIAGASVTIAGGQGTGTGNGGSLNFKIADPGSTGSSLNSLATVFSLSGTNGSALLQNTTDSATALRIQNAAGTATIFNVDTSNQRAGINTAAPGSTFQVNQSSLAPGTVSNSASSASVTGTSTTFFSTFQRGDTFTITSSGNTCTVLSIASDTALTCTAALAGSSSGSTYSFTQQARATVGDNGTTNLNGTLIISSPTANNQFTFRNDTSDNTLKIGSSIIGNASNNGSNDSNANFIQATKFNSGPGGSISVLRVFFPTVDGANPHFKVAVYSDSAGSPNSLLSSATAPSTTATAGQWSTASLGATVTLTPNTDYWLATSQESGSTTFKRQTTGTNTTKYQSGFTYSTNFPGTYTVNATSGDIIAIYAPYMTITDQSNVTGAIKISENNEVSVRPIYNSDTALQVLKADGTQIFNVNTFDGWTGVQQLMVGSVDTSYNAYIAGNNTNGALGVNRVSSTATDSILELLSSVGGSGTLKMKVTADGTLQLAGGGTKNITTASAASATAIGIQPGDTTANNGTGAAVNIAGGDTTTGTCGTSCTAGNVTIQGGAATANPSGTRNGGSIYIDAGSGATSNGTINIGTLTSADMTIGKTTGSNSLTLQAGQNVTILNNSSSGSIVARTATNSATGFQIQDSASAPLLTADTTARSVSGGNLIKIGNSTGTDTALTLLQLDAATADPTTNLAALNGGLFYNSTTNKVSIIENGAVKVLCNKTDLACGAGATTPLQTAYNDDVDGGNATISLTTADDSLVFTNPTSAGTDSAFLLQLNQQNTTAVVSAVDIIQASNASNAINVTANAIDTETALAVSATALTTGFGLDITTGSTTTTGGGLRVTGSGATAYSAGNGLIQGVNNGAFTGQLATLSSSGTTTGTLLNLALSNISQTTTTALSVTQSGVTTGYTGNLVSFTGSSTTGTGNVLQVTSVNTTNGNALSVTANSLTTGKAVTISSSAAAQTTATLLTVTQSGTTTGFTGNTVAFTGSSTTGTGNLLQLTSVNTTNGNALNVTSNSLTTGKAVTISSSAAAQTTATLLTVTQSGTTTGFTGNTVAFTGSSTTGTGNLLQLTSVNTTNGSALNVTSNAVTTGKAVNISSSGVGLTTGSLLAVSSATTGAVNTNGIVSLQATGNYTSTSNNGLLNVLANTTAAGTIANIQGGALTTGVALNIAANTGTAIRVSSGLTTLTAPTSGSGDSFSVSNSTSTGNIAVFKDNATTVASIADGGAATFQNQTDGANAFRILASGSGEVLGADTTNSVLRLLNNNNPAVVTGGWTTNANSYASGRFEHASVTANGYVYVIAGDDNADVPQSTVYYAKLNADGSIGTWATTTALPSARTELSAVTINGYIYAIGGRDSSQVVQTSVYYAKLKADGTVGSWNTTTVLPLERTNHTSVTANGFVYVLGGDETGGATTTVYYARANADGTLGSWSTTTAFSASHSHHASVVANGYVYSVAGTVGGVDSTEVDYAKLNTDGTIGSWSTTNALPNVRSNGSVGVLNGYIYHMGGASAIDEADVFYAQLGASGTVSSWTQTTDMNAGRRSQTTVTANGRIYVIGGEVGTALANQEYASPARVTVGGALDLVSLAGENLAEGSSGGQLTAGDTLVSGQLTVTGTSSFKDGIAVMNNFTLNAVNDSTAAFAVINSSAVPQFSIDTSNSRVYIGNPTADSTGALLVLDTKNTSGDPTGVLGAMYFNSNSGKMRCFETDQGTAGYWRDCVESARTAYRYTNEMMTTQADQVVALFSGNAGSFANVTGVANHPGINELRTGTNTNGSAGIGSNDPGSAYLLGNGDYWRFETVVNIPGLSDGTNTYTFRAGFSDGGAGDGTDGCFFRYGSAINGGKWQGVCRNGGGGGLETVCDTTITVAAATWYRLTLVVNTAGNSVDFQTNGTSRCQVTSNIPTTATHETSWNIGILKSAGTTGKTAQIDYVEVYDQFGTPR